MSAEADASAILKELFELSAFDPSPHLYGDLRKHLLGTWRILSQWNAGEALQRAGLVHAAYGTEGFPAPLLAIEHRDHLSGLVGEAAERLVYDYAACVRDAFYGAMARNQEYRFVDRFNGVGRAVDSETASALCQLTAANEVELLQSDPAHWDRFGAALDPLITSEGFRRRLSPIACSDLDRLRRRSASD